MRIIPLVEQSPAWRAWRREGFGGSDAAVLCGLSRDRKVGALFLEKRGLDAPQEDNLRLARGRVLERQARATYEARAHYDIPPQCVVHDEHPFLRASLDGWNKDRALPVELKAPTRSEQLEAFSGRVPKRFLPHCLHILLVTGAERMHYVSLQPDLKGGDRTFAVVEVRSFGKALERLFAVEQRFWDALRTGQSPPRPEHPDFTGVHTARVAL